MDKQKEKQEATGLHLGKYYRCRPTMSQANIIGSYLVDLEGLNLQFFSIKDFTLFKRIPVLTKEDQYGAQLSVLSSKILVIFGVDKFFLFNIQKMEISQSVKINNYIQKIQVRKNFVVVLSSDEDSQNKIINCWRIDPELGKVEQKYKGTQFSPVDYEECDEDNLCMNLILSIEGNPKVYIYWKNTTYMIEVDPRNQLSQKYNRHHPVTLVFDLSDQTYAEIVDKAIIVNNKKTGKKIAQLVSEGEKFIQLFSTGDKDKVYSLSNHGLKRWKLQSNSTPSLYVTSDKQHIKKIFLSQDEQVIGLNLETNTVLIWKNPQQYSSYAFPNEVIRRAIKMNEHQIFFILQATASSQQQNQYHVSKYNKLQVFDFNADNQIAKKAMLKSQHSVVINSAIVNDADTIRFVVNQKGEEGNEDKKYILRWTPFTKDQNNKDTKKKQIKGAHAFDILRLYPFNKILGFTLAKKSQSFSLFARDEQKSQVVLYDFNVKKIGDYDLNSEIINIELSEKNRMYAIGTNRVFVYSIATELKNRLQKINELDIAALSVSPFRDFLLVRKETSFLLLDADFECIMREEASPNDKNYKILEVNNDKFLLKSKTKLQLWDIAKESVQQVNAPQCDPNVVQFMDNKLVVADKWVQVYDIKLQ